MVTPASPAAVESGHLRNVEDSAGGAAVMGVPLPPLMTVYAFVPGSDPVAHCREAAPVEPLPFFGMGVDLTELASPSSQEDHDGGMSVMGDNVQAPTADGWVSQREPRDRGVRGGRAQAARAAVGKGEEDAPLGASSVAAAGRGDPGYRDNRSVR